MRYFLSLLAILLSVAAQAGPPQVFLDVARFRNLADVGKGAEVEIYVTVPTQNLTYRQRAPKSFQSAANVTLEVLKADGKPAYREVVTLKPPVLNDTTISIKNPQSFLKRIALPDGRYTLRATVRDQYRSANGETTVERPLVLEAPSQGAFLSDIVLLAKPAARGDGEDNFFRGGYRLTRAPLGFYGRGVETIYFYTELHQATAGTPVRVRYYLQGAAGKASEGEASLTPQAGKPAVIIGQLPLGNIPEGPFTLLVEVLGGKKLLAGHRVQGSRSQTDYAPAGAGVGR